MFFGIIKKKSDSHLVLNKAYSNLLVNGSFVTLFFNPRLATCYSEFCLINFAITFLSNLANVFFTYYSRCDSKIVYREFSNYSIVVLLPLILPVKHKIFLNVNHNITNDFFKSILPLAIISKFGIKFILFDGAVARKNLPMSISSNIITPMFPIYSCVKKSVEFKPNCVRIGFVGDFRVEKGGIEYLTNVVNSMKFNKHIEWCVGSKSKILADFSGFSNVNFFRTNSDGNYFAFLSMIDILIVSGTVENYMFRHSGTIVDAIANDVIVIASDLYVFNEQLTNPVRIGFNYSSIDEIPNLIESAIVNKDFLINNIKKYKSQRRLVCIEV